MPAFGSAKPSAPPAPGDPNELALPNECEAKREAEQHVDRTGPRNCRQARVRDVLRQCDLNVRAEWRRDLVPEELSERTMLWIDSGQELFLVEPKRDGVVRLPCYRFPRGLLASQAD